MTQPNIPNITPIIDVSLKDTVALLLSSIALEEISLAHILNVEAEKVQFLLGTLDSRHHMSHRAVDKCDLLELNESVRKTVQEVLKLEMVLQSKLDQVLVLFENLKRHHCEDDREACE